MKVRSRAIAELLATLLTFVTAAVCQSSTNVPGTYADPQNPFGQSGPSQDASIWKVDPLTGFLSVHLPFLSVARAGRGPWVPYSLVYNSGATVALSSNIIPPSSSYDPSPGHQAFEWSSAGNGSPAPWAEGGRRFSQGYTNIPYTAAGPYGGGMAGCTIAGPFILQDENGSHDLGLVNIQLNDSGNTEVPASCSGGSTTSSNSFDGSTLASSLTSAVYPDGTVCTVGAGYPSGSGYAYNCNLEDTNGNTMSLGTSGTTYDSLGRPLYSISYYGTSGWYPSQVTTYTADGSAEQYNLQWGSAPYSFTMPEPTTQDISTTNGSYPAVVYPSAQGSLTVLNSVSLPDSTSYQFSYDPTYGTISRIMFPTGGYVRFAYDRRTIGNANSYTSNGMSTVVVTDVYLSTGTGQESHWNYTYQNYNMSNSQVASTVTAPDGTTTSYVGQGASYTTGTFSAGATASFQEISHQVMNGSTPVRTVLTTYGGTGGDYSLPATVTTIYDDVYRVIPTPSGSGRRTANPQAQVVQYSYDKFNNVTEKDESDLFACAQAPCSPPSWLRKTLSTYYWSSANGAPYLAAHIVNKPYTITIMDGAGNPFAETQYGYDETPVTGLTGIKNHDDTTYSASNQGNGQSPRGNKTSEMHCVSFSGQSCSSWIKTTYTYDLAGQVTSVTDPCGNASCSDMSGSGHTTTFGYADNYTAGNPSQPTDGFVTSITKPQTGSYTHTEHYSYYFDSGQPYQHSDENSNLTTYSYNNPFTGQADPFNRIGSVTLPPTPDGTSGSATPGTGQTQYTYSDVAGSFSVTRSVQMSSSKPETQVTNYDGLGRVQNLVMQSDPAGPVETDTTYDSVGRVYSVSNPYRSLAEPSYGFTTHTYDSLSRPWITTNPDDTTTSLQYSGTSVSLTDEAGNTWTRSSDGLGRLTSVAEPNFSFTSYSYDPLDNLISAQQSGTGGTPTGFPTSYTEQIKNRRFTYDGLSRLLSAQNPESGLTCYGPLSGGNCTSGYDANSNLSAKTDANGMTVSYKYDSLNRLIQKWAADADNLNATFTYDQGPNALGRLTAQSKDGVAGEAYGYDAMGRVTSTSWVNYMAGNITSPGMQVVYDLTGNPTILTYPDNRVVRDVWDQAGNLQTVTDVTPNGSNTQYFGPSSSSLLGRSSAQYLASGALANAQLGDGVVQSVAINNRLQPCREAASSPLLQSANGGNIYDRQSYFNASASSPCGSQSSNNGNIYAIVDNLWAGNTQSFAYDPLNRLTSASDSGGYYNHTYNYDSFGNMIRQDNLNGNLNYSYNASNQLLLNNTDLVYDAAGDLIQAPNPTGGSHTFLYTGEHYLRCVDGCQLGSYLVDGEGKRTFDYNGTIAKEYVYLNGQVMTEYGSDGNIVDYIYANGQKIARISGQQPTLHTHGDRTASGTNLACGSGWTVSTAFNIPVQANDVLAFDQKEVGSYSGIALGFSNGGFTNSEVDQNGQMLGESHDSSGSWQHRVFNLNDVVGNTIVNLQIGTGNSTPPVVWDTYYANMAVIHANGTISPLFTGQSVSGSLWSACGGGSLALSVDTVPATDPKVGVDYYVADQVGTTQMELAEGGWPIWQGQFTPFGQEIIAGGTTNALGPQPADGTSMRYKFTGKERDQESGFDYFGARYYASALGRWTTPDWADKPEPVPYSTLSNPQTLNLYSYVTNNPVRRADMDGHIENTLFANVGAGVDPLALGFYQQSQTHFQAQQQSGNPGQPTDSNGKPLPPPVPMPGAPDMPWVWQPDTGNDRRGTWGPGKGNWDHGANGNAPSGSWEEGKDGKPGHWDIDNGRGRKNGGRSRYGADGTPIPDGQQHRMGLGSRLGALIHDHPIAAGAIIVGGAAIYVGAVIATGGAAAPAIAVAF